MVTDDVGFPQLTGIYYWNRHIRVFHFMSEKTAEPEPVAAAFTGAFGTVTDGGTYRRRRRRCRRRFLRRQS
ncbi:MAG: hypothetical protein LUG50_02025, partial [Planctomycetaceae bacterium]|nr:hypothetical protein [Planctomycetaceae bacterium]